MGGFTVNGCGATDKYYHLKNLGSYTCPMCNKKSEFYLDEVKRKIDIFYIPTATISVKHAIMCGKCKRGWYISDTDKDSILSGEVMAKLSDDGVSLISTDKNDTEDTENIKEKNLCPKCSCELQLNAKFCMNCGYNLSDSQNAEINIDTDDITIEKDIALLPENENNCINNITAQSDALYTLPKKKYCQKCNMFYVAQKEKCTICGNDLIEK